MPYHQQHTSTKLKVAYGLSAIFVLLTIIAIILVWATTKVTAGLWLFAASWIPLVVAFVLLMIEKSSKHHYY